ncbi:hypothetical protein RAB80_014038 [Fusarium oxysporum f. sp. vasinfectum]|uniref:Uncharacterized protein n=1 Tax=Fusarium oxysporum f. sp. vasinfectum 25433 TaxID=1089449 RepID=X0LZ33_FUSOX|nr:hypothetical protein FOTG_17840 [Fusarium oxysporum f. sp. vasinfectum 25433]KAK2669901.1 hypothetical protein RAB80_014038 [Fusarium oxysporum f. sp. vasinfectum]KAK2923148.1 hypothetical protein FoTM2_016670 [Fusarium oxysporum f. sp. vasinfectum]
MRDGASIDALFKLAFYADLIVLLDSVSPRSQVIDQSREGIKSLQYVIGIVEDAEKIALKAEIPPLRPHNASRANNRRDIRRREAGRIDARNSYPTPVPWLRRLGSALHLNEFGGRKDFLRDLIGLEYEVNPNNPDESDDGQLGFIHIAFDRMVNHAKAVITPDITYWYALFEVNRKELEKDRVMLGRR